MKNLAKLPLFMGMGVLALSLLVSVATVSEKTALIRQKSQAATQGAVLSLKYTEPGNISLVVNSEKEIVGLDAVLKYSPNIRVIPDSLKKGQDFSVAGGNIDSGKLIYSFSAINTGTGIKAGIVATFSIEPTGSENAWGEISFLTGTGESSAIEKNTGNNILKEATGIKFTLPK